MTTFFAVNSIGLHLLAVVLWFGGIIVLALLAPTLEGQAPGRKRGQVLAGVVLQRYSGLATIVVFLMIGSGLASAIIRITNWGQWATPYGALVIVKLLITLALGALGLVHPCQGHSMTFGR